MRRTADCDDSDGVTGDPGQTDPTRRVRRYVAEEVFLAQHEIHRAEALLYREQSTKARVGYVMARTKLERARAAADCLVRR